MVIKEDDMKREDGYIIHWKTKGAKDGIRRYQSYAVAPTRSGMVGQEIGEAAKQRQRIENRNTPQGYKSNGGNKVYRDLQELRRQSQNNRSDDRRRQRNANIDTTKSKEHMPREISNKTMRGGKPVKDKPFKEKMKEFNKKRWAKSYRKLYRHRDQYTVDELNDAMYRLGVEDTLKRKMGSLTVNTTKNGADIFKNLVSMAGSGLGMWNAYASAQNAYNTYKGNGKQMLPNALGKGTLTGYPKPKKKDDDNDDEKKKKK